MQTTAADWIEANLEGGAVVKEKFVGGSDWSSAYVYTTQQGKEYFVKLAMGGRDDSMFQGEAQGLNAMYGECVTRWKVCEDMGIKPIQHVCVGGGGAGDGGESEGQHLLTLVCTRTHASGYATPSHRQAKSPVHYVLYSTSLLSEHCNSNASMKVDAQFLRSRLSS